jgi:methylmalonyl-CoA mutase
MDPGPASPPALHELVHPVRVVTAASRFDGHDASINIMRRILQAQGAEVIHLGHHRSVDEVVAAVVEEDADAVAVSSYQGGHVEYFTYLVERLQAEGMGHVGVYGGGGGVISPDEVALLAERGVRIFTPADGQRLGLAAMVNVILAENDRPSPAPTDLHDLVAGTPHGLARVLTAIELGTLPEPLVAEVAALATTRRAPVLGVTGPGGSGKSTLTDELVLRFRLDQEDKLHIVVLAVDPTRRRTGGALLGDRIRMNAIDGPQVVVRSIASRSSASELPESMPQLIQACQASGADVVIVETPGIGQGDAAIADLADVSLYVMTAEYGAASQLEKIDMLGLADAVAVNKYERRGAPDALREVRRQIARDHGLQGTPLETLPVFGTIASRFNDDGVTALYQELRGALVAKGLHVVEGALAPVQTRTSTEVAPFVPEPRRRYLAEVAEAVRGYHAHSADQVGAVRAVSQLEAVRDRLRADDRATADVDALLELARGEVDPACAALLDHYRTVDVPKHTGADRPLHTSLSDTEVPRIALPRATEPGELLRFLRAENLPGHFPYAAGVFPMRRQDEDPTRMFAGEGGPAKTNARFHYLAAGQSSTRLSVAFDSVTLYGADPDEAPDVYGKVGNSGVSVATLDDMADLFAGFDLCDPSTSVSMTINGPAPAILAMYLCAAIDQHPELEPSEVVRRVRGTVQADILKEEQGQNTCILASELALRMMTDIQEWFVTHEVRRFYSV